MKRTKRILKMIAIITLVFIIFQIKNPIITFGWDVNGMINNYDNSDYEGNTSNKVTSVVGSAINITSIIAAGIAIIMLIVLGITYVLKSPEEKANVKESLNRYIVGIVLMFGTSGILKLVQMFIDKNLNNI